MDSYTHIIRTKRYRLQVQSNFKRLKVLKAKEDVTGFYTAFLETIPELRNYLYKLLKELENNKKLPSNFYEVNDFIDDLFLIVYDSFKTFKDEDDFYIFLFVQLDLLIDKAVLKEQGRHDSIESLNVYEKQERDLMIEKMAAQLDGDLILTEELDDISYRKGTQEHLAVFEIETVQGLDQKMDEEKMHDLTSKQVQEILENLPRLQRNIASLYIDFHLTIPEIIKVTKASSEKVHRVITDVKNTIKNNLFNI